MKIKLLTIGMLMFIGVTISGQIGINTASPKTTMDVSAKRSTGGIITDNSQIMGLQAPRLTLAELTSNTATYGIDQQAALIYITDVSGDPATGQRININAVGYYIFDGALWQKIKINDTNIYNTNGFLTSARTLTNNGFGLTFLGASQSTFWASNGGTTISGIGGSKRANLTLRSNDNDSNSIVSSLFLYQDPEAVGQVLVGGDSRGLSLGSTSTTQPAPVTFMTSTGSNANGTQKMILTASGNLGITLNQTVTEKLDVNGITRVRILPLNGSANAINTTPSGNLSSAQDQTFTATRTVVADTNGVLGYINGILAGQPWNNVADNTSATANTHNIYQMGKIGIMTNNPTGLLNIYNNSSLTNALTVESDNAGSDAGNDSYFYGYGTSKTPGLFFLSANGTKASPTILGTGNLMGEYNFGGYLSSGWNYSLASVRGAYDGDGTTLDSSLDFLTSSTVRMKILANGNVGIGTSVAKSKVHVATGDVYIEQVGNGVIMKSPNGNCWRVTVSNTGTFTSAAMTCP
ncbi:hypothetical protein A0O34_16765 [Chryseobacterium glaciei]|uniref:Uncharacterized protein n=1 Tax=Chryseobacterium glaciei TaxID=1685010 RepID=A0A172XZ33_9FLAO|nr:hypothetical protein [Chryseobacterium glaciei]ANF52065.1 hypothetical protein A0O34_16765 [Chryseobacterium glaciei]